MKFTYNIEKEEWLEGYDLSRKLFKRKFVYIRTAMFAVPLLLFINQVWIDPNYTTGWFCIAICIAAIAAIFAEEKLSRRTSERALDALKDDRYVLEIEDDRLKLSTILPENDVDLEKDENGEPILFHENGEPIPLPEIQPTVIDLKEKGVKAIETERIIGVFSKDYSAVIPKRPLSVYELNDLKAALKLQ